MLNHFRQWLVVCVVFIQSTEVQLEKRTANIAPNIHSHQHLMMGTVLKVTATHVEVTGPRIDDRLSKTPENGYRTLDFSLYNHYTLLIQRIADRLFIILTQHTR